MDAAGLTPWILSTLGALVAGGVGGFVATRMVYAPRLREALGRVEHLQRTREQANELLMQARRQADMLSKELELSRRVGHSRPAPLAMPVAAPPSEAPPVPDNGFSETVVNPIQGTGFSDTQAHWPPR